MGVIRVYRVANGYRARVLVRDPDGHVREMERLGVSRSAAERALKEAFRDRAHVDAAPGITPDTRGRVLARVARRRGQDREASGVGQVAFELTTRNVQRVSSDAPLLAITCA